jgi:hypothetical protein
VFFWNWVDNWVHLMHVGANPLNPHAEHGHEHHNGSQTKNQTKRIKLKVQEMMKEK